MPLDNIPFKTDRFNWLTGAHHWKPKSHKRFCRAGTITQAEYDRLIGRSFVYDDDPPDDPANSDGIANVVDLMQQTTERADDFLYPDGTTSI